MEYCKLQVCCLAIVLYIAFCYYRDVFRMKTRRKPIVFDGLLICGILELIFDGATAYTVNHLDTISMAVNDWLHLFFLGMVDTFIFLGFLYVLVITDGFPKTVKKKVILYTPLVINLLVLLFTIDSVEYRQGELSNYSMGVAVYTCYIMAAIYITLTEVSFWKRWRYIEVHKRSSIAIYLIMQIVCCGYQMFHPDALISCLATTVIILGAYIHQENPAFNELARYHHEMVMGFATMVESRDNNTGGHIRRTSMYAELLARELRQSGFYKKILTKDYIKNLKMAAPMHDVGKIAIPDAILQKPGKLTDEEYAIMKSHAVHGGQIIKETFANLRNPAYSNMAYEVAMYHHEKWNGKGYPCGLKETQIPLCARIMAVADVFDALSEKRCYRDPMPLDKCFQIIQEGRGTDFDPVIVDVFLASREKIEQVYASVE